MTRITKQCRIVLRSCEISFSRTFKISITTCLVHLIGIGKPYPTWIDSVPFPPGYVMPQFCMFNALSKPEQDLAHFLSRCGETSKNGALCLRQFLQSLEGDAFVWYSKLPPGLIPDWDSLVARFHKHFYSTHRSVSVTEFSEAKQRQHESVDYFIARWRKRKR